MHRSPMKMVGILACMTTIAGCLATTDLLREPGQLSPEHQKLMQEAVHHVSQRCVTGHYAETSGSERFVSPTRITQRIEIRNAYASDAGWLKLYIVTKGVFDHVYYNPSEQKIVCGDKDWQKNQALAKINFRDLAAQSKDKPPISLGSRPPGLVAPSANTDNGGIEPQKQPQAQSTPAQSLQVQPRGRYLQAFSGDFPFFEFEFKSNDECAREVSMPVLQSAPHTAASTYICAASSLGQQLPYRGKIIQIMTEREYMVKFKSRNACLLARSANKEGGLKFECR